VRTAADIKLRDWLTRRSLRERLLLDAGFDPTLARLAAQDQRFDVHALIQLSERGCPPELAVRIMAPLDQEAPT
jgi:hypothetical protein